jgi:hypothetical protein
MPICLAGFTVCTSDFLTRTPVSWSTKTILAENSSAAVVVTASTDVIVVVALYTQLGQTMIKKTPFIDDIFYFLPKVMRQLRLGLIIEKIIISF